MTGRPRLLDLFCGAGGAAMGYHRAGFDVYGIDHRPQHGYPFLHIEQADALHALADLAFCRSFDVIHASPPCQAYTALRNRHRHKNYPDLVAATRDALERVGRPYVIENVEGAPLRDPIVLCGSMFALELDGAVLRRHRIFEASAPISPPSPDTCRGRPVVGVYGTGGAWTRTAPGGGGTKVAGEDAARLLGIDWTTHTDELSQSIPPAYTQHIGEQLIRQLAPHP